VIIVLAVIIVPRVIRESPRQTTCTSNHRQVAASLQMYAQDHKDMLPYTTTIWSDIHADPGVLVCPKAKRLTIGYLYNNKISGINVSKIAKPDTIFMTVDGKNDYGGNIYYSPANVQYRHDDYTVASFADGHITGFNKTAANLPWDLPVKMVVEKPVVKPAVKKKSKRNK
jgi:hypothetical protein